MASNRTPWEDLPLQYRIMYGSPEEYRRRCSAAPAPGRSATRPVGGNVVVAIIGAFAGIGLFIGLMAAGEVLFPSHGAGHGQPQRVSRTVNPPQQKGSWSGTAACYLPIYRFTALCT